MTDTASIAGAMRVKDIVLSIMGEDDYDRITNNPYMPITAEHFRSAEIVLWDNSLFNAAINGQDAFSEMPQFPPFLCGKMMFWAIPRCTMESVCGGIPKGAEVPAIFVFFDPSGSLCAVWRPVLYPDNQYRWGGAYIAKARYERLLSCPEVGDEKELAAMKTAQSVIAAGMFLGLPFIDIEERQASRSERRRAEKAGKPIPSVQMVVLRRSEKHNRDESQNANIEWSCQWLVRGHWRKLHEPRKSDGAQVVYVQPYAKGPEDMPFRAARETVYVAKR